MGPHGFLLLGRCWASNCAVPLVCCLRLSFIRGSGIKLAASGCFCCCLLCQLCWCFLTLSIVHAWDCFSSVTACVVCCCGPACRSPRLPAYLPAPTHVLASNLPHTHDLITCMSASRRMSAAQCMMKLTLLLRAALSEGLRPRPGRLMSPPTTTTLDNSDALSRTYDRSGSMRQQLL